MVGTRRGRRVCGGAVVCGRSRPSRLLPAVPDLCADGPLLRRLRDDTSRASVAARSLAHGAAAQPLAAATPPGPRLLLPLVHAGCLPGPAPASAPAPLCLHAVAAGHGGPLYPLAQPTDQRIARPPRTLSAGVPPAALHLGRSRRLYRRLRRVVKWGCIPRRKH